MMDMTAVGPVTRWGDVPRKMSDGSTHGSQHERKHDLTVNTDAKQQEPFVEWDAGARVPNASRYVTHLQGTMPMYAEYNPY